LHTGGVFGVGRSNIVSSGWTKYNRYLGQNNAQGLGVIRSVISKTVIVER